MTLLVFICDTRFFLVFNRIFLIHISVSVFFSTFLSFHLLLLKLTVLLSYSCEWKIKSVTAFQQHLPDNLIFFWQDNLIKIHGVATFYCVIIF